MEYKRQLPQVLLLLIPKTFLYFEEIYIAVLSPQPDAKTKEGSWRTEYISPEGFGG
jgi:hypothetical protein